MADMRTYLLSLGAGLLVGVVDSPLNVRSTAPPVVALMGLLGILIGEEIIPVGRHMLEGSHMAAACRRWFCMGDDGQIVPTADDDQRGSLEVGGASMTACGDRAKQATYRERVQEKRPRQRWRSALVHLLAQSGPKMRGCP